MGPYSEFLALIQGASLTTPYPNIPKMVLPLRFVFRHARTDHSLPQNSSVVSPTKTPDQFFCRDALFPPLYFFLREFPGAFQRWDLPVPLPLLNRGPYSSSFCFRASSRSFLAGTSVIVPHLSRRFCFPMTFPHTAFPISLIVPGPSVFLDSSSLSPSWVCPFRIFRSPSPVSFPCKFLPYPP